MRKFCNEVWPWLALIGVGLLVCAALAMQDVLQQNHARKTNKEICESYSARAYELGKIPDMCWQEWK